MRQANSFKESSGQFGQSRLRNDPSALITVTTHALRNAAQWNFFHWRKLKSNHIPDIRGKQLFSKAVVSKGDALSVVYQCILTVNRQQKTPLDVVRLVNSRIKARSFGQRRGRSRNIMAASTGFPSCILEVLFSLYRSEVEFCFRKA